VLRSAKNPFSPRGRRRGPERSEWADEGARRLIRRGSFRAEVAVRKNTERPERPIFARLRRRPLLLPQEEKGFAVALAFLVLTLALAPIAHAQDRAPAQRQTLIDLAYVLGESHALRQLCAGFSDQYWRERMQNMVHAETPDADLDRRMKAAFNTGFIAGQSGFPACGRASRREEGRLAERGRTLAASLTGAVAMDAPPR
jgi:uncharacterized protein (TIGR02301 family)